MTQDELNKVTQDVIAELKKNGTNIADASVVSDISQVNNLVAYGKNGKVIKVTPRTIQESVVKHVAWNDSSRLNDFTTAGVYEITGERKMSKEYDNLPIDNSGSGHTISARLEVLDSSINDTTNSDDKCITQKLTLSNRVGGDGNVYIRTGRGRTYDSITWEKWGALQTNINVGQVRSLDEFVDNGIYSGVWTDGSSFAQTFVMVVINDYAVAGDNKTIVQYKYAYDTLKGNGEPSYNTRSLFSGVWSDWEDTHDDDLSVLKEELLSRIQGRSENSDATKDPFKFIGNYNSFEALIEKLDTMHGNVGATAQQYNGHFRAMVGTKLVEIINEVQGYATNVWSQRITCAGLVLRNDVVRTETSYSNYSNNAIHKYRQHRYVQKFVNSVGGGANFDTKGGVKTFCRRHYLTGNNVSTWTPWYDVENPYVQTQNYGKKIAIFGGSFAQNMAVNSSDYQFTHEGTSYNLVDYIAEKLGAVAFDDYAVGGQGMRCDENSPFPVHIMNQLKTAQSKGIYDIYIIMGGVNDYWGGEVPLGDSAGYSAENENASAEQKISYCGGMRAAVDYIRQIAPDAKVYTITPFKGYNIEEFWNPKTATRNALGNSFYEFVQAQKEVAQVVGVPCLDLWVQQGFSEANAYLNYLSDLLHPNGNGYYKVSEKIVEFVAHGVGNEVVDVQALTIPLDVKITEEIQRATQAEQANADAINAEKERAKQAEQANRQLIADLVGESPETLDTIHEISSWILNDETGAAAMAKEINENKNAIAEEAKRAEKAEKDIANNLSALGYDVADLQDDVPNIKNQVARFDGNAFSATANEVKLTTTGVNTSKQWTVSLPTATTEKAGVMSAEDKKVLENLYEEAVKFDTLEVEELGDGIGINYNTFDGNSSSIEIPFATEEKAGVMSAADKKKLDNLSEGGGKGDITAIPTDVVIEEIEPTLVSTAIRKTPQVLTDSEKGIARENICAVGFSDLNNAIAEAITNTLNTAV